MGQVYSFPDGVAPEIFRKMTEQHASLGSFHRRGVFINSTYFEVIVHDKNLESSDC